MKENKNKPIQKTGKVVIDEGMIKKGGVNVRPTTPRPPPPKGQGGSGGSGHSDCKDSQAQVLMDVLNERIKQDVKWGEQNHDFPYWMVILMEEIGEANQSYLESLWGANAEVQKQHTREELVQCTAVLVAMIECMDRESQKGTP